MDVRGCAWVCVGVRGCAWVCVGVPKFEKNEFKAGIKRMFRRYLGDMVGVWGIFS